MSLRDELQKLTIDEEREGDGEEDADQSGEGKDGDADRREEDGEDATSDEGEPDSDEYVPKKGEEEEEGGAKTALDSSENHGDDEAEDEEDKPSDSFPFEQDEDGFADESHGPLESDSLLQEILHEIEPGGDLGHGANDGRDPDDVCSDILDVDIEVEGDGDGDKAATAPEDGKDKRLGETSKSESETSLRQPGAFVSSSPRSEGRGKPRAPLPPTDQPRQRSASFTNGSKPGPSSLVKYHQHHTHPHPYPHRIRFLQLSYNTNLKKPPENWLRMKHRHGSGEGSSKGHFGSSFWSYPFSKSSSWSMFSSFRYGNRSGSGHGKRNKQGLSYSSLCLCCECCACSHVNQTCCCCCYHCVHTISSCRRSDLLRLVPVAGTPDKGKGPATGSLPTRRPPKPKLVRKRSAPEPGTKPDDLLRGI